MSVSYVILVAAFMGGADSSVRSFGRVVARSFAQRIDGCVNRSPFCWFRSLPPLSAILRIPLAARKSWNVSSSDQDAEKLQGLVKRLRPGLVNFVPAASA